MMRLSRLGVLRSLASGQQPGLRGMGPVKAWLYKHELMAWDQLKGVVLTDKGRVDMDKANTEYAARPKHCTPRAWELRYQERLKNNPPLHGKDVTVTVTIGDDASPEVRVRNPPGVLTVNSDVSPEARQQFAERMRQLASDRMIVVLPPTDVVNLEVKADQVAVVEETTSWVPPPAAEPTTNLDSGTLPMPADELGRKRREKEQVEKAAQLAKEIAAQQDAELKFATEIRVLDAYREIAIEIGNLGQGVEDVYVGKLHDKLIQFNPFIPGQALVFYPSRQTVEKIMVGYDVAKALITGQPPAAVAFDGLSDLHDRCGETCWRCRGTGNLSRNYTVNDKLCPECCGTGRKGGK